MSEFAIPLIRVKRKRPRKPEWSEAVGLLFTMVGAVEVGMCLRCLSSGSHLGGEAFGHDRPHDATAEYALMGFAAVCAVVVAVVGLVLAWSWIKNPWKDD